MAGRYSWSVSPVSGLAPLTPLNPDERVRAPRGSAASNAAEIELVPHDARGVELLDALEERTEERPYKTNTRTGVRTYYLESAGADAFDGVLDGIDPRWSKHLEPYAVGDGWPPPRTAHIPPAGKWISLLVTVDCRPRRMLEEGHPLGVVLEPDLPLAHDARVLLAPEAESQAGDCVSAPTRGTRPTWKPSSHPMTMSSRVSSVVVLIVWGICRPFAPLLRGLGLCVLLLRRPGLGGMTPGPLVAYGRHAFFSARVRAPARRRSGSPPPQHADLHSQQSGCAGPFSPGVIPGPLRSRRSTG
jgi:hypothetical protein